MRTLCHLDDLPEGTARAFPPAPGTFTGLFAIRRNNRVHAYVNACPHIGVALDHHPGHVLTPDATEILCSTHGARFTIETGLCTAGPCQGQSLEPIPVTIHEGHILVPADAGL